VGRGRANEEAARTEYGEDVPMQRQSQQRSSLAQIPKEIMEELPPPITDDAMPGHRHQSRYPTQHPLPIKRFNHNPTHDGLTGVIIGDQAPFEHRLTQFDVYSVYMFLRDAERYETSYNVELNLVNFITEDILDAISASTESTMDLPSLPRTWSPRQLKIAMTRYFHTFKYTREKRKTGSDMLAIRMTTQFDIVSILQ
jgi:hypothetical protein